MNKRGGEESQEGNVTGMWEEGIKCISHTAGCGVPETTPAPENNVAICPGGGKKYKKN